MELIINLQLFAEEKTEKPTAKKIKDAREKGQVLQSKEINSAFILLAVFVAIYLLSSSIGRTVASFTSFIYEEHLGVVDSFSIRTIQRIVILSLWNMFKVILPLGAICMIVGLAVSYAQVGYLFTTKTLEVKLSKLNPIEGFKRMFSLKSVVELVKSLLKIVFVGIIMYRYAMSKIDIILGSMEMSTELIMKIIVDITIHIGLRAGVVLIVLAILDYYYQKYEYDKSMKMSKQEVKEEFKQMEGNPQIKSKIKEKQRQMAMGRMMQDVPKADVIITNPTHYAIAIQYNPELFDAPKIIAKGQDLIAQNIKKIAAEHNIAVVENKPLARALYDAAEVGEFVPPELYQGVAEVLAYVYQMNNRI